MKNLILTNEKKNIVYAAQVLKSGGLVAIPTETVYGLAANALDQEAVSHIFKAKGRPSDNPLIVHIAKKEDLEKYAYVNEKAWACAERFWPGPLTMILPKKDCIPDIVSAGLDTVAVRLPANETARQIILESGLPLAAPSANISGRPSPTCAEHVYHDFGESIDAIIAAGPCVCGVESTVITLASNPPVLLRPGFVTPEQLKDILPDLQISPAVLHELPQNAKVLSPGLKHKHYAPKAQTTCVIGSSENCARYIHRQKTECKTIVLCFDEEQNNYSNMVCYAYGKENDAQTMARNIFELLRRADEEHAERIFIHAQLQNGVGLAVYNRLLRACGFDVVDADQPTKEM